LDKSGKCCTDFFHCMWERIMVKKCEAEISIIH